MSQSAYPVLARCYHLLMSVCGALAALLFGLMSVLVTIDVLTRNLSIDLVPASVEISEYMLMVATFVAAPWLLYKGGHIRIDVLVNQCPPAGQKILAVLTNLIGGLVCAVLAYQSLLVMLDLQHQQSLVFKELVFPEWWLSMPLLLGSTLLTVEFIRRLFLDFSSKS